MEAKDLRIGNYYIAPNERETILTLDLLKEIIELDWFHILEPIPLTEEWILRFGFIKTNSNYLGSKWFEDKKSNFTIEIDHNGILNCNYGINNDEYIEIKFVHTFQNLYFALVNEELSIGK